MPAKSVKGTIIPGRCADRVRNALHALTAAAVSDG
jgi:hypothetical protein